MEQIEKPPHLHHCTPPVWGFDWLMRERVDWLMTSRDFYVTFTTRALIIIQFITQSERLTIPL